MHDGLKKPLVLMVSLGVVLALGIAGSALAFKQKPAVQEEEVQAPEAIPEAAQRSLGQGLAIMERAQSPKDYEEAARALEKAVGLAPQWREAYYNLAQAQEAAEKYPEAIKSLRKYLALSPPGEDVKPINIWIYKLEDKMKYMAGPGGDERLAQQMTGTWIDTNNPKSSIEIEATGAKVRATFFSDDPDIANPVATWDAVVEKGRLVVTSTYYIINRRPDTFNAEINLSPDGRSLKLNYGGGSLVHGVENKWADNAFRAHAVNGACRAQEHRRDAGATKGLNPRAQVVLGPARDGQVQLGDEITPRVSRPLACW